MRNQEVHRSRALAVTFITAAAGDLINERTYCTHAPLVVAAVY